MFQIWDDIKRAWAYLKSEGLVIRHAPVAFIVCVGAVSLIIWQILNWQYEDELAQAGRDLETRQSTIESKEERLQVCKDQLVAIKETEAYQRGDFRLIPPPPSSTPISTPSPAPTSAPTPQPTATPAPPNKYICVVPTNSLITRGNHGLLIEFGVRREPTDGQVVGVDLDNPLVIAREWTGQPLRTDEQPSLGVTLGRMEFETKPNVFQVGMQQPNITPQRSLYVYLETVVPAKPIGLRFLENPELLFTNRLRADELARQYGPCPRG